MRPEMNGRIAERARPQLGLITYDQLDEIDVTRHARAAMVASGRWEQRGRRVLGDRAASRTPYQEILAAVLDVPGSVATAATGAWIVGLPLARAPFHVLVKRGGNHRPRTSVLHETFWLPPTHTQLVHGVPCVSDARLCFELAAARVHPVRLRRLVDRLHSERGMPYPEMARVAAELCRRGKPGSAAMRLVVDERMPGYVPPASELEAVYGDVCNRLGLRRGVVQLNAGGEEWIGRVDVAYPDARLLVELDSRRWHDTSTAFEHDRARTNALVLAGWRVIRITWRMLHDEPEKVVALIRAALCGGSAA